MKKHKPSNGEFPLPEKMIQHIQSFLRVKEAARSSIISKSWHAAWSTRPNLEFNLDDFAPNTNLFWEFMEKTMQRYEEFNFKIESLVLFLAKEKSMKIVEELIVKAMKMGTMDFNFENKSIPIPITFTLPHEVLGSETLIRLSLLGCKIDPGKVCCSGLKYLSLTEVEMGSNTLLDIVSSCPLIEDLSIMWPSHCSLIIAPFNLYKLKSLMLGSVDVDSSFFSDLSSKFPFLKELIVGYCRGYQGIQLFSPSLECISFTHNDCDDNDLLWAKWDVPNIRKFTFVHSGPNLPSLSLTTSSTKWESDITLYCTSVASVEWFLELNKFLNDLRSSKISLALIISDIVAAREVDFQGFRTTAVENLDINGVLCDSSLFVECLFQTCRPNFIAHRSCPLLLRGSMMKILYNALLHGARRIPVLVLQDLEEVDVEILHGARRIMLVLQDLEEVDVEIFEQEVREWQPFPWKTLLSHLSELTKSEREELLRRKRKIKLRLQLRWRDANMT